VALRSARVIDVTPDVSEVTGIAGSSFSLVLTFDADGGYTSSTHDVSMEIRAHRDVVPAVTSVVGSWASAAEAVIDLSSSETSLLAGTFKYAVWLTNQDDDTDRVVVMRGHLSFENPYG
jgi:hypothetical protein